MSFDFNPQPVTDEGINLNPQSPALPEQTINDRAARADYALGQDSPGHAVLKDEFTQGNEGRIREMAARGADNAFKQQKLDMVNTALSKGASLSPEEMQTLVSVGTTPEANPNTVLEDKFARNVVTAGVVGDPGKNLVFQSAFEKEPDKTNENTQLSMAAVSRKQQARDILEQTQAAHDSLPWVAIPSMGIGSADQQDKVGDLAKSVLSLGMAQYVNQRNLLTEDPIQTEGAWLPGSNKAAQISYLYRLPHAQFKDALMAAAGPGSELFKKSPSDALDFVKAAVQFSSSDAYVDNLFGIINVGSLVPGGAVVRAFGRFGRSGETAFNAGLKTAEEVLKASSTPVNAAKKANSPALQSGIQAVDSVLSQSSKPPTPSYYVPEAAAKNFGSFSVKNGKPVFQKADGAFVDVSRTPQPGHTQITPTEPTTFNQYTNKQGTFDFAQTAEGTQVEGRKTVFTDQKGYETLSQVLDEANHAKSSASGTSQRFQIMEDDKGNLFVGDRDKGGKAVPKSKVKVSTEPTEGSYPIHLPEGNDPHMFEDFGSPIEQVKKNYKSQNYKIGATIASQEDLDARTALADITKSQGYTHPQEVLSKMGQHDVAAQVGAEEAIAKEATNTAPLQDPDAVSRAVPSIAQPRPYFDGGASLSWRRMGELVNEFKAVLGGTRVERLTPTAYNEALNVAQNVVKTKYNRLSADSIRDQVTHWDAMTNTYAVETKIGLPNGDMFASRDQAVHYKNLQYRMGSSAEVKQEGTSYYLSHIQHVDETQTAARQALVIGNETPQSLVNVAIGRIKSAASTLSRFQMEQRATATHAQSYLRAALDTEAEKLSVLHKGFTQAEKHELNDILIHNRDYIPPTGAKDRGFFYNSQHDFDVAFQQRFGHTATAEQWEAYEHYTRLSDVDWLLRESEVYRDKARQGVRNYRFSFTNREGQKVQTEFMSGKEVPDFNPMVHPNANVYVLPDNIFTTKNDLKDASAKSKLITDKLKSGEYKIVQVYDPRSKPLNPTTGIKDDIHFVVTNKFDEKAIQFGENVEYRPGGHVIYLDQHYLKQPQIGPGTNGAMTHFGDVSLKAFSTRREAEFWGERYNIAREHLLNNRQAAFDAYVAGNLPETPAQLRRMFADGTFNLEHPFMYTHAGRDTLQSNEKFLMSHPEFQGLKDTFSAYNMKQTQDSAFLADRGAQLNTIEKAGTAANPIYNNVPAPLMDPYSALQKGMSQIVQARWMTDIKHMAAESWIQEFGHFFDQSKLPIERLRLNPWYYINHLDAVDRGKMLSNPEAYAAMKTARANILRFVGAKDEVGGMMDALNAAIVDKIAGRLGDKTAVNAEQTYLPFIKNVPQYMRRATFDLVDGLGNIVQLFQQAVGATHSFAVSPKNAFHSVTMSALGRRMARTEDAAIHDRFLDIAASMGWDRNDAKAAFDAWRETGVHNVGGEVTQLSELDNPTLFKTTFGKIIDKGRYFFTKGEQINRDVAFFTAFRDWRDMNAGRVVDNRARTEIMGRFDTLYLNMSRASNTFYNEGVLAIPTQFWTWNARFAEQMLTFGAGKQLTIAEKSRVMALNSLLWGVPSALGGATLGVIPYANYDDIRQYALSKGINVHDKVFQAFSEGVPNMLFNAFTGHETSFHRFAPNADQLRIFKDIQTGKKDWFELAFGASGSMFYKVLASVHPFYAYTMSAFQNDGSFKVKLNDFVNAAEQASGFNNYEKAIIGWNTGKYISKNEQLQTDVDKFESVMLALGLDPQRVSDAWSMKAIEEARKSSNAKLEKRILEDSAIAFRAAAQGDTSTFNDYMGRVKTWSAMGDFTSKERKGIWKKALHGQDSLVDNVDKMWLNRHPQLQQIPNVQQYFENLQGNR